MSDVNNAEEQESNWIPSDDGDINSDDDLRGGNGPAAQYGSGGSTGFAIGNMPPSSHEAQKMVTLPFIGLSVPRKSLIIVLAFSFITSLLLHHRIWCFMV